MAITASTIIGAESVSVPIALPGKPTIVCGITLEYTPLDPVLAALGMSSVAELEAIMAPNKTWPFPGCMDGWKRAHDAVRYDMDNFLAAVEKTKALVDGGQCLQAWQVSSLQLVMNDFYHAVHKHHDHEEEIFFPYIETRVKVPSKMSADHKTLMALMDKSVRLCTALRPTSQPAAAKPVLDDLHSTFVVLRATMRQHLEEEEIVGLPLMRKHFTFKDMAVPEKKLMKGLKPSDMAWFVRRLDMTEKKKLMGEYKIPVIVQKLVLLPAIRKDARTVVHAYGQLVSGAPVEREQRKRGFAACFAA